MNPREALAGVSSWSRRLLHESYQVPVVFLLMDSRIVRLAGRSKALSHAVVARIMRYARLKCL